MRQSALICLYFFIDKIDNLLEIIKYLGPFIGIFIGWFLTRKSDKDKLLREDKIKLKRTLKNLLDIRHEVNLVKSDDVLINTYLDAIKNKFGELSDMDSDQTKKVKELFTSMYEKAGLTIIRQTTKTTKENFEKAVDDLSEVDPILAYRLSGKQHIQDFFEEWEDVSKTSLKEFVTDSNEISSVIQEFRPKLINETLLDLNSILIEIATQIDRKTLRETKEIVSEKVIFEKQIEIQQVIERVFS